MKKPNKNQDTELLLTPPKKLNRDLFSPTVSDHSNPCYQPSIISQCHFMA